MAISSSTIQLCSFSLLLLLFIGSSSAQTSFRPKALVVPVTKDAATNQYVTKINQRTPLVSVPLVVHLGGEFMWVDCDKNYVSLSYRPVRCRSAQCNLAQSKACGDCFNGPRPGCNNNTCGVFPHNAVTRTSTSGELAEDVVSVNSTNGSNPGKTVSVNRFIFSCGSTFLLEGLANGAVGMAGLGRTRVGLPLQFASAFSFNRKFAICLSPSNGVIFFGNGPYNFLPNIDVSQNLIHTPLLINPESTAGVSTAGQRSADYFIGVKLIKIQDKIVPVNASLLKIDSHGNGGTMISTVEPYTVMQTSIFNAVTTAFIKEAAARNITRVRGVAPFEVCFSAENVGSTRVGPAVPFIFLDLQGSATWTITGANSMVDLRNSGKNVLCLGILDGGEEPRTAIVIGGYQLENNLLQFDLASSRLGFSSTLLGRMTTCANFNYTSNA